MPSTKQQIKAMEQEIIIQIYQINGLIPTIIMQGSKIILLKGK